MSINSHALSILKYAGCSEETFILALIYMDQVVQFNPEFVISSLNVRSCTADGTSRRMMLMTISECAGLFCRLQVHRLLITAIMLASKFFDDVYYNNAYYARVGGISNSEVRVRVGPLGGGTRAIPSRVRCCLNDR